MHVKFPSTIQLNIHLQTLWAGHYVKHMGHKEEWDAISALKMSESYREQKDKQLFFRWASDIKKEEYMLRIL